MEILTLLHMSDLRHLILFLLVAFLSYWTCLVIYRLYLSPLAGFPGPRLAAATGWYEFYFDFWLSGKYIFEIEKMHIQYGRYARHYTRNLNVWMPRFLQGKWTDRLGWIVKLTWQLGPIVRVNPDELSIHDAAFYNEIYVTESKRRTENYDVFCKGIDFDGNYVCQLLLKNIT